MIKVLTTKDTIIIKGHALYDDYGKDIVCSAVSSIVITSINGILAINKEAIKYESKQNELIINILSFDSITNKLIQNMLNLLIELSNDYPKNIMIKEGV